MPMFELTCELATLEPPPTPRCRQLIGAMHGKPGGDGRLRERRRPGTLPVPEFFGAGERGRILAEAGARAGAPAS